MGRILAARRLGAPGSTIMPGVTAWAPGTTIVHQEVWFGRLWAARPLVVVADDPGRLLLWIPEGTVRKVPATPSDRADPPTRAERVAALLERREWVLVDHVWDVSSLWILEPDAWHAIWVSWLPSGEHLGWYVNLQRPFRRTSRGIVATDLLLDVVAEPDLTWRWKDADEVDLLVARGTFDPVFADRIRAEGEAVIARIERRGAPFDEPWPSWRPDPSWTTPELPPGWDIVDGG